MTDAELSRLLQPWLLLGVTCIGACVGSFLNVLVFRIPRRCLSLFDPKRSHCPTCRHAIRWYENVPLLSWAFVLRARCPGCALPISVRYPLVEAATALLFLAIGLIHLDGQAHVPESWGRVAVHCLFGSALLVCALTDWDLRVIPDVIDVPGILLGPVALALVPGILGWGLPDLEGLAARAVLHLDSAFRWWGISMLLVPVESLADWLGALSEGSPRGYRSLQGAAAGVFGAAFAGCSMWILAFALERIVGREALGFGDVKLMAMIGAFTGWQGVLVTLLIGSSLAWLAGLLAILAGRREENRQTLSQASLPLGSFLVVGALVVVLGGGEHVLRAVVL